MYLYSFLLFTSLSLCAQDAQEITTMPQLRTALASKLPVVILVYAPWCGACKRMHEPFNKVAQQLKKEALLIKVNAENETFKEFVDALGIEAIPTIITKHVGVMDSEQLTKAITGLTQKLDLKALQQEQKPPAKAAPPAKQAPKPSAKKTVQKKPAAKQGRNGPVAH
jgi:thioredoxin-like negative regulator of GroEL